MFNKSLDFVMRQRFLVLLGSALLLIGGITAWTKLPIDAFPDVTNVQVMILTQAPGLTPLEVERQVTFPIETEMSGLPDVRQVRSLSKSGLSQVVVVFEDHVDTYFSRQLVFERLAGAREQLPEGLEPEMGPISTGLGEIYQYLVDNGYVCEAHPEVTRQEAGTCETCGQALQEATHTLAELRTIQDWLIAPQLRRLDGINEVNSFGGGVRRVEIRVDPDELVKFGLKLRDVMDAVVANNMNTGAGFITQDWEQFNVVAKGMLTSLDDIRRIAVSSDGPSPVLLGDIAVVTNGVQPRTGAVTHDAKGEAVAGMAIMLKGENSKYVVDRVKNAMVKVERALPSGVVLRPFYDRTDLIGECVRTVKYAMGQGAILVVIVLFLLLGDLRAAATVVVSLVMTAASAFLIMSWQGITANLMSLGGLAIAVGMVVDAAIIVTENISRHMHEKANSELSRAEITWQAVVEVARPVAFAVMIIVVVFVPLLTLESLEGKMFRPLALTIIAALVSSMVVSITVVPALASLVVKRERGGKTWKQPLVERVLQRMYGWVLEPALKGRWVTIALGGALVVGAAAVVPQLGTEFLPDLDEGAIAINVVRLPSAGLEGSAQQCLLIEKRLREEFPEIKAVVSKTGRAEIAEDPMGPEQSDLIIMLHPKETWADGRTKADLISDMEKVLQEFPGINPAFSQPIALRVNELISGIKADVAVKLFGPDIDVLRRASEQMAPVLARVQGAADVNIEQITGASEYQVTPDRSELSRHGINVEDLQSHVLAAIGGANVSTLYEGQRRFAIAVKLPERFSQSTAELERLLIPSPRGYRVPLGELAEIELADVPAQISREAATRRHLIEINVRGRDMGGFVTEAQEALAPLEANLPDGYWIEWGGQFENQQRAMARLRIFVPLSLALIFVLLFSSLNSLRSALLVFFNLPFAVVGGILTLYILDLNFSVSASIGFIALLGASVQDGLVLVSFFDRLRQKGLALGDAVRKACHLRVRSVVMTSLTTLLGLLPMLYGHGTGSELQKPLVAVVFGGLVSSLLLTLIMLPVLYLVFNRDPKPERAR